LPERPEITTLLDEARAEHVFSGYQCLAAKGASVVEIVGGVTSYWEGARAVTPGTFFDIGSVTKVVATVSLAALAVQDRTELRGTPLAPITATDLLTHSSGLEGWLPIFRDTDRAELLHWYMKHASTLMIAPRGTKTIYSDIGFILLGLWLERLGGAFLHELFDRRVVKPLGLSEIQFGPVSDHRNVAATEYCLIRKRVLQGEVFDENSAFMGGKLAHAGLFATARGLLPWAREWLNALTNESKWLSRETALLFTTPAAKVAGSTWALGWDTKSAEGSTAGERFSMKSFGHLGYPGCSVWIDPTKNGIAIFHTNRIHPSRYDERIKFVRPKVHDEIHKMWETA
jgi:CubicO group peptidase (beta-lactamase class C family)